MIIVETVKTEKSKEKSTDHPEFHHSETNTVQSFFCAYVYVAELATYMQLIMYCTFLFNIIT